MHASVLRSLRSCKSTRSSAGAAAEPGITGKEEDVGWSIRHFSDCSAGGYRGSEPGCDRWTEFGGSAGSAPTYELDGRYYYAEPLDYRASNGLHGPDWAPAPEYFDLPKGATSTGVFQCPLM